MHKNSFETSSESILLSKTAQQGNRLRLYYKASKSILYEHQKTEALFSLWKIISMSEKQGRRHKLPDIYG
jgi:hypothetical protein